MNVLIATGIALVVVIFIAIVIQPFLETLCEDEDENDYTQCPEIYY